MNSIQTFIRVIAVNLALSLIPAGIFSQNLLSNPDTFEATTIISSDIPQYVQDLAFDPVNNRLIVVAWEINSPIKAVNLSNNSVTTIKTTQLGNFDGVVRDSLGNLYVPCHRDGGKELIVSSSEPCLSVSRKMFWRTDKNL